MFIFHQMWFHSEHEWKIYSCIKTNCNSMNKYHFLIKPWLFMGFLYILSWQYGTKITGSGSAVDTNCLVPGLCCPWECIWTHFNVLPYGPRSHALFDSIKDVVASLNPIFMVFEYTSFETIVYYIFKPSFQFRLYTSIL